MKNILIPTNFSTTANKAVEFAIRMAAKAPDRKELRLVFVHITHQIVPSQAPTSVYLDIKKTNLKEAKEKLTNCVHETFENLQLNAKEFNIHYLIKDDYYVTDNILDAVDQYQADLVIMGTHDISGWEKLFFGNHTLHVLRYGHCPMIVIPEDWQPKDLNKIAYASDLNDLYNELKEIIPIAKIFQAKVEVFHICPEFFSLNDEKLIKNLKTKYNYEDIAFHFIHPSGKIDVENEIENFVSEYQPDLLVVVTHEKGFFEKILDKSISEDLVSHPRVPLMILKNEKLPEFSFLNNELQEDKANNPI
jgi:nucleotide-binding universal stress UspA family protein